MELIEALNGRQGYLDAWLETKNEAEVREAIKKLISPEETLRDKFAAKAMQGMLAYPGCEMRGSHHNNNTKEGVAIMAYEYADAMLAARNA